MSEYIEKILEASIKEAERQANKARERAKECDLKETLVHLRRVDEILTDAKEIITKPGSEATLEQIERYRRTVHIKTKAVKDIASNLEKNCMCKLKKIVP